MGRFLITLLMSLAPLAALAAPQEDTKYDRRDYDRLREIVSNLSNRLEAIHVSERSVLDERTRFIFDQIGKLAAIKIEEGERYGMLTPEENAHIAELTKRAQVLCPPDGSGAVERRDRQ